MVLIIQDEHPAAVQRLKRLLNDLNPHTEVLDIPGSVEDAINWFRNNPAADIVFMDIQLEDGICFEILRKLKSEPTSFSPPRLTNMPLMRSKRTVWITC